MATYNLNQSGYWGNDAILTGKTWAALVWNDVINLNGFNLTVDPAVVAPAGIDVGVAITNITNLAVFKINNASTSTPVIYYGPRAGVVRVESGCQFVTTGAFIEVYTGDGAEGQTTTGWTAVGGYDAADEPGAIEVETGSGTGVYEQWLNIGNLVLADIGVGVLGKWFSYDNTTGIITFGDGGKPNAVTSAAASGQTKVNVTAGADFAGNGWVHIVEGDTRETIQVSTIAGNELTMATNLVNSYTTAAIVRNVKGGNLIPSGAKVRVYNIGIGTKTSGGVREFNTTIGDNLEIDGNPSGVFSFSKTYFFGLYPYFYLSAALTIDRVACLLGIATDSLAQASLSYLAVGIDRYTTAERRAVDNANSFNWTWTNCKCARRDVASMVPLATKMTFSGCEFWIVKRTTTDRNLIASSQQSTFSSCLFIGGRVRSISDNTFTACGVSESAHGAYYGNDLILINCGSTDVTSVFDGLFFIPDGASGKGTALLDGGYLIKNSTLIADNTTGWTPVNGIGFKSIKNVFRFNNTTTPGVQISGAKYGAVLQNHKTGFLAPIGTSIPIASMFKGVSVSSLDTPQSIGPAIDTHFYEIFNTDTTGAMGIFFSPKSELTGYTISNAADVVFNYAGKMFIVTAGGWIEYTWPHIIKGITAFPAEGTIRKAGSGTGNFTVQYKIDLLDGNGYSANWIDLTAANLDDHTIDASKGFRFKLKISHASGSASDYLDRLNWDTTVDYDTYPYPEDLVTVTLQNVADGSEYWVYNQTTSQVIANGTQSGSDDIEITGVPYNGSAETLLIRVRKSSAVPKYIPFETNATLSENGALVWISQVADTLAA